MDLTKEFKNNSGKKSLGRGLGSLLGAGSDLSSQAPSVDVRPVTTQDLAAGEYSNSNEGRVWSLAIEKIVAGKYQPRTTFDKQALEELSQSIKESGILQPIIVRSNGAGIFELVAGERRWRAAQLAGLKEVPAIVKQYSDEEAAKLALIENIQRQDLNAIDEAEAYKKLISEFGLTQAQVAEKVGKDRVTITNSLRLLTLSMVARQAVVDGQISSGHAKILAGLDELKQDALVKEVIKKQLSVRKLEALLKEKPADEKQENDNGLNINISKVLVNKLADELQKLLSTKVEIQYQNGAGNLKINFYTDEELTNLTQALKEGYQK